MFPGEDDDVVTAPYNSILALNKLTIHSDCVIPIENQSLYSIYSKLENAAPTMTENLKTTRKRKAFDGMNNIISNVLLGLTR